MVSLLLIIKVVDLGDHRSYPQKKHTMCTHNQKCRQEWIRKLTEARYYSRMINGLKNMLFSSVPLSKRIKTADLDSVTSSLNENTYGEKSFCSETGEFTGLRK